MTDTITIPLVTSGNPRRLAIRADMAPASDRAEVEHARRRRRAALDLTRPRGIAFDLPDRP